ncbi:hypothetical protein [Taylorella equigenitalis]|uniref:hypothetical protein n=1 Tax=Taylorella equigenitalis TaxID=29575 RepID=UPI00237DA121|nr:hypothetical protein [Taylorella equigenitalis]WDU51969.1 hypothetical protein KNO32_00515 [Taylorella equigenitalis]
MSMQQQAPDNGGGSKPASPQEPSPPGKSPVPTAPPPGTEDAFKIQVNDQSGAENDIPQELFENQNVDVADGGNRVEVIKGSQLAWIGGSEQRIIGHDRYTQLGANETTLVIGADKKDVNSTRDLTVTGKVTDHFYSGYERVVSGGGTKVFHSGGLFDLDIQGGLDSLIKSQRTAKIDGTDDFTVTGSSTNTYQDTWTNTITNDAVINSTSGKVDIDGKSEVTADSKGPVKLNSNGESYLNLENPNATLHAIANIGLNADANATLYGKANTFVKSDVKVTLDAPEVKDTTKSWFNVYKAKMDMGIGKVDIVDFKYTHTGIVINTYSFKADFSQIKMDVRGMEIKNTGLDTKVGEAFFKVFGLECKV